MKNKVLIFLFLIHLILDGYLRLVNKGTSFLNVIIFPILFISIGYNILQNGVVLSRAIYSFLLFFLFIYISFVFSDLIAGSGIDILENLVSVISLFLWPSLFLYFSQQRFRLESAKKLFRFIHFVGILIALNCLIPFLFYLANGTVVGEFVISEGKVRSFGYLTDQVGFALVYFFINSMYNRKILFVFVYAVAIVATGTRAAILLGAIAGLITWFYRPRNNKGSLNRIRINFFLGGAIIYVIFFTGFINSFLNIFDMRFNSVSVENTSTQRIAAMKSGISIFLDNPIFGIGYGNFSSTVLHKKKLLSLFDSVQNADEYQTAVFSSAQNQIIDIAANGGILSLLAVIFFLYYCIKRIRLLIKFSILEDEFKIILIYLISMLLFDQSALYLFNFGICSFLLMMFLGLANARYQLQPVVIEESQP
ncbi:MAG: O-antigen ligase family protein [Ferruginibacter sp.]